MLSVGHRGCKNAFAKRLGYPNRPCMVGWMLVSRDLPFTHTHKEKSMAPANRREVYYSCRLNSAVATSFLLGACLLLLDAGKLLLSKPTCSHPRRDAGLILHVSTVAESPSLHLKSGTPSSCKPSARSHVPPLSPWWGVLGVYELFLSASSWANVINEGARGPFWT